MVLQYIKVCIFYFLPILIQRYQIYGAMFVRICTLIAALVDESWNNILIRVWSDGAANVVGNSSEIVARLIDKEKSNV